MHVVQEIKLLFALSAALLDASISAWDTKYQYVAVRPLTAITKVVFEGQEVRCHSLSEHPHHNLPWVFYV